MLRRAVILIAALAPLVAAAQATGQAAPPMPDDPRAPRFHEVERGAFVGFESGWLHLNQTRVVDARQYPSAAGGGGHADMLLVGTSLGYDVTDRFALSAVALAADGSANPSYGAFSLLIVGGDARLSLIGARDGQGVERFYAYLHARAGFVVTRPYGLFGTTDTLLAGGPGIEYFTRLRHFSVGAAFDVVRVSKADTFGFAVFPTVRYTF